MIKKILLLIYGLFSLFWLQAQSPGGVSGSTLWYRADAGVTVASGVSQWNNSAQSNYNLTQATAANRPAYNTTSNLINFNPSIRFDGVNDVVSAAGVPQNVTISGSNPYSTSQYVVYRQISGSNPIYQHSNGSGGTWNIGAQSDGQLLVSNRFISTTAPASNEVRLQGIDGTSNAASSYLNGALSSSTLTSTTSVSGTQPFWVGSGGTASFANVDMAEIVVYNTAQANRPRIESYLSLKYGITKSGNYQNSAASVVWDATANTGYNNNIAGISRDDASGLNQKQSQSQNSGIQPVIGNGNIFDTNANNTNNFNADQSALIWGSDTGTTSFATSFVFGSLNARMTRIWKVQETGTLGTVKVAIPASQISGSITQLNLVVSSDATFDGSDTRTAMTLETLGGVQYYTATVDFTSGQFFTFASFVAAPGGVLGSSLWLKADAGTNNVSYFNVASGNRTASSNFSGLAPANSTLSSSSSWSAATATTGDFLTLDLGSVQTVYGVVTKGRGDFAQWVTGYSVSYSNDNINYVSLGGFSGNTDQNTEIINLFTSSVNARYIRFTVTAYSGYPSLRADVVQAIPSVTTDNATITAWLDQSGNSNHVAQPTSTNRSLYRSNSASLMNFNPVISFDGTNDFMDATTFTINGTANTLFSAVKPNVVNVSAQDVLSFGAISSSIGGELRLNNAILEYSQNNPSFSVVSSGSIAVAQVPILFGSSMNNVANGTSVYQNNRAIATGTINQFPSAANLVSIGSRGVAGRTFYFNGLIPEVVAYNSLLTATQRQRVNSYLAIKYGITMDQTAATNYLASDGTTALWNAATNTGYNNNIAGIARDDASALNQKQSQSVNSGIQPVIGNGNIFDTNANNTNNFTADLSALVWGSDTGSTSFATSFVFGGVNNRMARIWKVQETGTVGTVKVALPVTQLALSPNTTAPALVVSSDAVFDGTDTRTAMTLETLGGVQYYTATVDFTTGQFFTFAALVTAPGGVTSGLRIWHKADAGVTAASNLVTAWTNQADGRQVINSGGTQRPTLVASGSLFNFNPYLDFTAATNALYDTDATPFTTDGDISYFVSLRPAATAANDGQIFGINNPSATGGAVYDNHEWFNSVLFNSTSSVATSYSPSMVGLEQSIATFTHNGATNIANGYRNLNVIINNATVTGPLGSGGYAFGADSGFAGGDNNSSLAQFSEHIAYNRVLSATEIQRVQSYLAIKTGVSLNQSYLSSDGTAITWNTTTNAGYNNNIAGIGRDDLSALYQKQSRSVNTGSHVVMSLGTVAASNQANANTIPTDKQFFIWGDDNGSLTNVMATGNSTYPYRFTRVWKTQNTGSFAENMTVYYPVSAFGNAAASTVALLYGATAASLSNGTALAIAQSGTTTINSVSYYMFTVPSAQVANMQFFSFTGLQTSPGGVTGMTSWFKADAGVTLNGSNVSALANQSANTNLTQLAQPTASRQPAFTANSWNFNPGITYDGTSDILENTFPSMLNILNATNNEVFGALSVTGGATAKVYFQVSDNGSTTNRLSLENTITHFPSTSNSISNTGLSQTSNLPSIINFATGSGSMSYAINGNAAVSAAFSGSVAAGTTPRYMLGAYNQAGAYSHFTSGNINEVATYDRTLTTSERQRVQSYLGLKYGQTMAHNYIASDGTAITWNTTTNAGYNNNIAGIGRDDLSALYQKQSRSVNTGSHVVMSLGTVAASNQANANTIPTDKQFFIWGDDNGSISTLVSTGNGTYSYRLTRIWKTQNTGTFAQNMTVYYPVSAFGNASASTVALLYGTTAASLSNGTASAIAQSGTTTINSVSYYAFTVPSAQVANMQLFSFTGTQTAPGGVTGSSLWLKADAGTSTVTNGATSTTWLDTSNNILSNGGNGATYNTVGTNFNPSLSFNGSNTGFQFASGTVFGMATGSFDFFSVIQTSAPNASAPYTYFTGNLGTPQFVINPSGRHELNSNSSYNIGAGPTVINDGIVRLLGIGRVIGTGAYQFRSNGINDGNPIISPSGFITGTNAFVGNRESVNQYFNGRINEIISYGGLSLTATEVLRINSYLGIKYGITLLRDNNGNGTSGEAISGSISEGDYVASDGTTRIWNSDAAYQNNIAGIGRDDVSALQQKVSRSVNSGSVLTLASNSDFATANNDSGRTGIANNLSFLVIGDDNGALTAAASPDMAPGFNSRIVREWRIQNTNYSQNASLQFSGLPAGSAWHLVWDADGNFASGAVDLGALNSSGQGTFTAAQLSSGYLAIMSSTACYKPAVTVGTTLDAKHGITALSRAGAAGDNWPMVRKGAWTVLEAKTKGFVINRLTAAQIAAIPPANLVEGMMVYDTTNNCMKVYTSTDGGTNFSWQCITTQTCPD